MAGRRLAVCSLFFAAMPMTAAASQPRSAAQLTGVVLDPAGAAISGASLNLLSVDEARNGKTGADGKFQFSDLPSGAYELRVSSPGFRAKTISDMMLEVGSSESLSVTLQLESNPCGDPSPTPLYEKRSADLDLLGFVSEFWNGSGPVAGATVTVRLIKTGRADTVKTGKRGEFQFVGLDPGKYTLSVSHAGYTGQSDIDFWITARNSTKFTNIYIFKKSEHRLIICQ